MIRQTSQSPEEDRINEEILYYIKKRREEADHDRKWLLDGILLGLALALDILNNKAQQNDR